ncbi:hypothetical protein [Phytohabitans suffuscus]|uniref:Uncharacterized protein n=1 Tax=Phytohabitans suffuscus TaxID=624315 RepID=A0A6F8Z0Q4_9ACTN|nr:hypothetical protein [Phytohabitans suffuscus]BCB91904.1 hypothetical protein Psuf_092170 [Phytohabitans suffuscus]
MSLDGASLDGVRAVADAVLYEGYLLYPYRASARKNRSRWQFGVLGPPGAAAAGLGEEAGMAMQCVLAPRDPAATVSIRLRFLQLQAREVQRREPDGGYTPVPELTAGGRSVLTWDEAVAHEIVLPARPVRDDADTTVEIAGGRDEEPLSGAGRLVRRRWPLAARVRTRTEPDGDHLRLTVSVDNTHPGVPAGRDAATRTSLIGAHLVLSADGADFVSLLDPPEAAAAAVARCAQSRCWPVLAGPPGSTGVLLGAPIILYDHPQVAEQSPGALYDSTEIDEILTLRVMTMTDAEKAEARATDPRAAAIVDRCDGLSAADLARLHGARRDPRPGPTPPATVDPATVDPATVDPATVDPATVDSAVLVGGVRIGEGSLVRLRPARRADAQDLFYAGQVARVTAVLSDVDGGTHVAVVLADDPAADLHEWYGRYLYFAPDELEPLPADSLPTTP